VQLHKLSCSKWKPYLSLLGKPQLPLFWVSDFMPQYPLSWVSDFMQIMNCRLESPTQLLKRGSCGILKSILQIPAVKTEWWYLSRKTIWDHITLAFENLNFRLSISASAGHIGYNY
jgi:hypothetical protein